MVTVLNADSALTEKPKGRWAKGVARVALPVHPDFQQCPVVANPQLGCFGAVTELPTRMDSAGVHLVPQLAVWYTVGGSAI